MASLNLSTNGPSISKSYRAVVEASPPTGPAAASPTYGQWAIFAVSTPLVNAFQQDSAGKESVLKVQSSGEGELEDLIEDFSDGRIQFAYVKVKDPNTGLPKNVLIGWCGEGVPEKTKGYFTSHLAAVSKLLHGYHVQISARSDRDLTPEGIVQKVADSSGSKYSAGDASAPVKSSTKPTVAYKPVFTPSRSGGAFKPLGGTPRAAAPTQENVDDDGWGADAPPVTRTQLEKVKPAYQPTKVNMQEIMSQKPSTSKFESRHSDEPSSGDVVKGAYQPVGKVDIAAIRRQARESGQSNDDRPEPVKGAYEPVGKVDIAAIRARVQRPSGSSQASPGNISPAITGGSGGSEERRTLAERSAAFSSSDRLTSLPKPKVTNKFSGASTFTGTKAPVPGAFSVTPATNATTVSGASRTFADQGGKTPAQLWAEKKARERGGAVETGPSLAESQQPLQSQSSGGAGWKSSYTGKSWAPVQTTHTGGSGAGHQRSGSELDETNTPPKHEEEERNIPRGGIGSIRDRFANTPPMGTTAPGSDYARSAPSPPRLDTSNKPGATRVPIPGLPSRPTEPEEPYEDQGQPIPTPPQQPRSPTPQSPASIPGSPIRVAMPVGMGSAAEKIPDAHEEQYSPPAALPVRSLENQLPREENLDDERAHDDARAVAQAGATEHHPEPPQTAAAKSGSTRALVVYDYEKAEDNEINLVEGEYVTEIDMVSDDWWMGVNARGDRGLFPQNYVELASAPDQPAPASGSGSGSGSGGGAQPATTGRTATAQYDYEAAEDNELGFPEGATITNIEFPDEDWWHGEYNGRSGLFPANYVELN
ncbi:hypothetical protein RJZ56_001344 [Blastomyces dermatitidis]|uniref:Actin binding protein n=2 Tax=Blastomyces TaxID=229219 RepID=A0A179U5Y6_BLAGS|nr:actin binding protein [Blastomyces gilchristii SLH14081]XP_045273059.1 actin binding protein [Blastomyces dermatitidis ER-3]EEQ85271.1 actin binding protein [Blastomyces dermatitidis ER-3]EQL37579.1 hypothetical protein BDFG_01162 [Blastomyces dermatitidis ATCC 26199]OAT03414.1 actin binding protein [Blastomyces gilchristii SLH14081]